jgi:gamma-glutamylcyclotransferase
MKQRCPSSERVGIAILPKYRWGISCRGYANVYSHETHIVYGILYSTTPTDERSLDRYEGVSSGSYEKVELDVIMKDEDAVEDGSEKIIRALIYIDPRQEEGHPRQEYIERMRSGLKDAQLPEEWVKENIEPALSSGDTFENNQ